MVADALPLIADPVRWSLLHHLAESDRRVGDLVSLTGRAQNLVSYHLGALRSAGLVSGRRSAADGRDTYYRAEPERLVEVIGATIAPLHPGLQLVPTAPPYRVPGDRPPHLLFLCTGNSARSQLAAALVEAHSAGTVRATSAGSHPKPALHPNAVAVLAAHGLDGGHRQTRSIDDVADTTFDRVVTLCDKVKEVCPELPGHPVAAHWSLPDPAAAGATDDASYPAFEAAFAEIDARVRLLLARLTTTQEETTRAHR